jgi:O-antigen/teichoic acid export membrane protein
VKKIIKQYTGSEFVRNTATLMTGTTLAQGLSFALYPVLTRLFTPDEFGLFALYASLVGIFGVIGTGRYEMAIMLPEKRKEALNLVGLSLFLSTAVSLLLLLIVLLFNQAIASILGNSQIAPWLYLFPLSVWLIGVYQSFNYWNNRQKKYKSIATSTVVQSSSMGAINLGSGFAGYGAGGLITGSIAGQFMAAALFVYYFIKGERKSFHMIQKEAMTKLSRRYIKFPKFLIWSALLNTASLQLPVILLTRYFSSTVVGFYSLSHRTLSVPMALLGGSVAQVFFQKASENKDNPERIREITFEIFKKLLLIGVLPIGIIMFYGDYIFSFVFGSDWLIAGKYAQWLSIWILFNFISSPLSRLFAVLEKQQISLFVNIFLLAFRVTPIVVGAFFLAGSYQVIVLYALVSTVFWVGYTLYLLRVAGVPYYKSAMFIISITAVIFVPLYLIRFFIF